MGEVLLNLCYIDWLILLHHLDKPSQTENLSVHKIDSELFYYQFCIVLIFT